MPHKTMNKHSLLLALLSMLSTPLAYTPGMGSDNLALLPKRTSYKTLRCPDTVVCHSNCSGRRDDLLAEISFSLFILTHALWVNTLVQLKTKFKLPIGAWRCSWNSRMNSRLYSSTLSLALPWSILLCLPSDILLSHLQMHTFSKLLYLLHPDSSYKLNQNTCMRWKKRTIPPPTLLPQNQTLQKLCVSACVKASAESLCSLSHDHFHASSFHQASPYTGALLYIFWAKGQSVLVA